MEFNLKLFEEEWWLFSENEEQQKSFVEELLRKSNCKTQAKSVRIKISICQHNFLVLFSDFLMVNIDIFWI